MDGIDREGWDELTERVIGALIEVHRALGPDLLESAYMACLAREFDARGIRYQREVPLPVTYRGETLECGYRLDFVVEDTVVVELKSIDKIAPIHVAQLMTYLRLSKKKTGLILNFNVPVLKDGIVRRVL